MLLTLATSDDLRWAQRMVTKYHYLHAPVDSRCSVLAYVARLGEDRVGTLLFGRPEATRCYRGGLTYGSLADVASGRAQYSYWSVLNLARVWLDPRIQRGGDWYIPKAASTLIREALERVVVDYLLRYPPVDCSQPYQIERVLSYCDETVHSGYLYRVCRFKRVRVNAAGMATYAKRVRPLTDQERQQVERLSEQHPRSRRYRSQRQVTVVQCEMW